MTGIFQKAEPFLRLMRVDRPIGTVLVLMPALWSLWVASQGNPSPVHVFIFVAGSFLMRSAGCVINDIADRKFDSFVSRTRLRPIASGAVTVKEGLILFSGLSALSFLLVFRLNPLTVLLSFAGLFLAVVYPFSKRVISAPQLVLGISFGWGVILAWTAVKNTIESPALLIFIANIFWSLGYDTIYALMDRDDDLKIGVRSTAVLLGKKTVPAVGIFLFLVLFFMAWAGYLVHLGLFFYFFLALAGAGFLYQMTILRSDTSPSTALRLFKNHGVLGFIIFLGISGDYFTRGH